MFSTIAIGSSILVQGEPERVTPEGRLVIRVGNRVLQGWPVETLPRVTPAPAASPT